MPKYALTIEYIGTNYSGSQIQPNQTTIQSELEKALSTLTGVNKKEAAASLNVTPRRIKTIFSGRTDAGVHAKGQVVHFVSEETIVASKFLNSLNGILPNDISVSSIIEVSDDFHAQKSGRYRRYQYRIANRRFRSAWDSHLLLVREPLDTERMNKALSYLIGAHDFTSFKSSQATDPASVCVVYKAHCTKSDDEIIIEIVANRFLYNMVRTIVGTLLLIEKKGLQPKLMKEILDKKDRTQAGPTISPDGLTLMEVGYTPYCHSEPCAELDSVLFQNLRQSRSTNSNTKQNKEN